MKGNFDPAFSELMVNEVGNSAEPGGYTNNPDDPGGETRWGVTKRVARRHGYNGPMRELPKSVAFEIAKAEYWDPYRCDELPDHVDFQVFDAAYNGGHPAHWLQQAAGAVVDGAIGPKTLAAVAGADPDKIIMRFDAYRLKYMAGLRIWPKFGAGWANRIANNLLRGAA